MNFKEHISTGIPNHIPEKKDYDPSVNHAPVRENVLNVNNKKLALKNALEKPLYKVNLFCAY